MNRFLLCFAIFISSFSYSQQSIRVFDASDEFRVAKAKILTVENELIGLTDQRGEFVLPKYYSKLLIFQDGYDTQIISIAENQTLIDVFLEPLYIELDAVDLVKIDQNINAKKLINEVLLKQKQNDVSNVESYFFKSYTKYWSGINKDSIPYIQNPQNLRDSLNNHWKKILEKSHLFFGERAMDHKFSKRYGRKNIVQSSRISGFNSPIYEYMAIQPVALQFNQPTINFFFRDVLNPVSYEGLEYYRFSIKEKIEFNNRPTTIVSFIPKKRSNETQFKGLMYIDDRTMAIAKFKAENYLSDNIAEIDADWQYRNGFWFPKKQKFVLDAGNFGYNANANIDGAEVEEKKEKILVNMEMIISDLKSPLLYNRKEFAGYENEIAFYNMNEPKRDKVLNDYRYFPLTEIEQNTYPVMDSLSGDEYQNKERLLRFISTGGKLKFGKLDVDTTKFFDFNNYEGLRLGAGISTNESWSEDYNLNSYFGYGFKDEALKFGVGANAFVNKPYSGRLFFNYAQDVAAAGRIPNILLSNYNRFINRTLTNIYNDDYFFYHRYTVGYEQDLFRNFTFNFSTNFDKQSINFDYAYRGNQASYNLFYTQFGLRWAPKDEFVRTPYGKVTLNKGISQFYLYATKYWSIFGGDYDPFKIHFSYYDIYQNYFGETHLNINTGKVFGEVPITTMFEVMGNAKHGGFPKNLQLAGIHNFETMHPGEFYSSEYLSFHVKHIFGGFALFRKQIFPMFIYRGAIGYMVDKEDHQILNFNELNHFYQESGIEFNNLIFNNLGFGAYYRFGAYQYPEFKENLFLKLTFRMNLF
ncbi:DUF5686 family protein [Vaginella massiliensis]|uniref:DUF5686 family protein n=1 Tax=Vaginella massiliensis TaxID=1816680 RepID=UPI00083995BD|nr:DUF5686 family protein [Vaginella massiliensis]